MKKLLMIGILCIVLAASVTALGIGPTKNEIFFQPDAKRDLSFRIINNEHKSLDATIIVKGELKDYISVEQKVRVEADNLETAVPYSIRLPSNLEPGLHSAEILVIESAKAEQEEIVVANVGVVHKLYVRVPYPDEYLEGILYISEARPNEKVTFTISLSNVGSNDLDSVSGQVLITGPDRRGVAQIATNQISIETRQKSKITADWIANVEPGTYNVEAIVEYDNGKVLVIEKQFDVGEPLIQIQDVSVRSFSLGQIAKFDIMLKNNWNEQMTEVYANTQITDDAGSILDNYKTSTAALPALGVGELNAFWDTTGVNAGPYTFVVRVHYLGRVREKIYALDVQEDKIIVSEPSITGQVSQDIEQPGPLPNMIIPLLFMVLVFMGVMTKLLLDYKTKSGKTTETSKRHPELEKYIKKKLKEGYKTKALRKHLMEKGWNDNVIDEEMLRVEDEMD